MSRMIAAFIAALMHVVPAHHPHHHRRALRPMPVGPVVASWYDDAAQTSSGRHYARGFASLMFGNAWGLPVTFCRAAAHGCAGPRVTGRMDDHGPYVEGRSFDLDAALKAALGCSDLCSVRYRVG